MEIRHFYSANDYYKNTFGSKVYRLAIDGHFTCPNRDGSKGYGGCSFCSELGSGDFTASSKFGVSDISSQIENAKLLVRDKNPEKFIAYFQSFTGTYGYPEYLYKIYSEAASFDDIVALSIATRPDCINNEVIDVLTKVREEYVKPVYIELGLQTTKAETEKYLNRCYNYKDYEYALNLLNNANIPVITHLILGLPGENSEDIINSVKTVCSGNLHGIKLSLLHIIKGTKMEALYFSNPELFHFTEKDTYVELLAKCIKNIPKDIVIYRITGDAPKSLLTAPLFTANKKDVLNSINKYLKDYNIFQGSDI